jgi:hypothetical protein
MTELRVLKAIPQTLVVKDYVAGAKVYKSIPNVLVVKEFTPGLKVYKSTPQTLVVKDYVAGAKVYKSIPSVLITSDPSGDLRQDVLIDRPSYQNGSEFIAPHVEFQGTETLEIYSAITNDYSSVTYTKDREITYDTFSVGLGRTVVPTIDFNQYILYKGTINRMLLESLVYTLPLRVTPPTAPFVLSEGTMAQTGASTTLAVSYPAVIAAGDLLVMNTMSRSTTTIPTGWTRLGETPITTGSQRGGAYYKVADGTETGTLTVTQAGAERLLAIMQTVRSDYGTPVATWYNSGLDSTSGNTMTGGPLVGTKDRTLAIISHSIYYSVTNLSMIPEAGFTNMHPDIPPGVRLAAAQQTIDSTFNDPSVTWTTYNGTPATWHHIRINNPV